jgi:hypothetical protein
MIVRPMWPPRQGWGDSFGNGFRSAGKAIDLSQGKITQISVAIGACAPIHPRVGQSDPPGRFPSGRVCFGFLGLLGFLPGGSDLRICF